MSSESNTRSHLYWNTLLRIPVQAVTFIVSILITRALDPKDFGVMAVVMMLIGYSNLLTGFGLTEAVIQKTIRDKKTLYSIFTFDLTVSIFLAATFYLLSGYIADFFEAPEIKNVIKLMTIFFVASSFWAIPYTMLRRDMKFKSVSLFDIGKSLTSGILTLVLALSGYGYWSLAYGQIIPLVVVTGILCIHVKWVPAIYFSLEKIRNLFHFGAWNFFKAQIHFFAAHIDRFIVGKWIGVESLGIYDKAVTLSRTPYDSFTMHINSVMFSSFSIHKDNPVLLKSQFRKSLALVAYINFPVYLGLIAVAPYFVSVLLGEKWEPMTTVFQIILAGYIARAFSGLLSSLLVGIGKYRELTLILLASALLFMVLCFVLLDYGIVGMAFSYLIFSVVHVLLWCRLALKSVDMKWGDAIGVVIHGALASVVMFGVVVGLSATFLIERNGTNLIVLIVGGCLMYFACLLLDKSPIAIELKLHIMSDIKKLFT